MSSKSIYSGNPTPTLANGIAALGRDLIRFSHYFLTCLEVSRQRRHLRALDESALKDIGISRVDAVYEAHRGFWDIPQNPNSRRRET